ncbi:MAG: acyl-CoA dehydrogenase C-terminal domain-containing protein, partial [Pseudomonadota bacterium]|nr:acyl-CoA dehydrogenase C-terminal domain-containing protein [Pseudomonadota bacterium]
MLTARKDRDIVSAACNDYLMYSGYAMMAYFWAQMAAVAFDKLENGGNDAPEFYLAKVQTAEFYFDRLLPRASGHAEAMTNPSRSLMQMEEDHFAF